MVSFLIEFSTVSEWTKLTWDVFLSFTARLNQDFLVI